MNMTLEVSADKYLQRQKANKKLIALCFSGAQDGFAYPYAVELQRALESMGFVVWTDSAETIQAHSKLQALKACDLMVCKASDNLWYAAAVGCPALLITASSEPKTLMPDYATDAHPPCPVHAYQQNMPLTQACCCDQPQQLATSIASIFESASEHTRQGQ